MDASAVVAVKKSWSDGQNETFQRLLNKLIARDKFSTVEAKQFQALLENARESRNLQKIMEKLKECDNIVIDSTTADDTDDANYDGQ